MIFVTLGNAHYPCILLLEFEIHWGYVQKETAHVAEYQVLPSRLRTHIPNSVDRPMKPVVLWKSIQL